MESKDAVDNEPKESPLADMSAGYDQPSDPPSYHQAAGAQYPAGAFPTGYPATPTAQYPVVTQQAMRSNVVVVQNERVGPPVDTGNANACLGLSIFTCLCCVWPLGAIAICVSLAATNAARDGNEEGSRSSVMVAGILNGLSIAGGVTIIILFATGVFSFGSSDD